MPGLSNYNNVPSNAEDLQAFLSNIPFLSGKLLSHIKINSGINFINHTLQNKKPEGFIMLGAESYKILSLGACNVVTAAAGRYTITVTPTANIYKIFPGEILSFTQATGTSNLDKKRNTTMRVVDTTAASGTIICQIANSATMDVVSTDIIYPANGVMYPLMDDSATNTKQLVLYSNDSYIANIWIY